MRLHQDNWLTDGLTNNQWHKAYRDRTGRNRYITNNHLIRRCLKNPNPNIRSERSFKQEVGCSIEEMHEHLSLNEWQWDLFLRGGLEIDHILPYSFLWKKHPEYLPFFNRWFNVTLVPKAVNRKKKDKLQDNIRTSLAVINMVKAKMGADLDKMEDAAMLLRVEKRLEQIDSLTK